MCLNIAINGNWNGNYSYCRDNDWLYQKDKAIYSISPYGTTLNVDAVNGDGSFFNPGATSHIDVMPVLFLKDNITINGGNGTAENPYLIK